MFALAMGLLAISACSVGRPADDAEGGQIYAQLCANCHGENLEGALGPALGPGSNSAGRPDQFLEVSIMIGRGRMPSFSSTLDQHQLARLIDFMREVQSG